MPRLGDVSFPREARWLMVLTVGIPLLALLAAVVIPAVVRHFAGR
jgi:hypothetical protein